MTIETPRVLFLGTDQALMDAAARHGFQGTVIAGASTRDFGYHCVPAGLTELFVQDFSDAEQVAGVLLRNGFGTRSFTAVVTNDEFSVFTAALIAERFATRANDPGTIVGYRDKSLQKNRISAAGIRTARHVVIEDRRESSVGIPDGFGAAGLVVKPLSGAATSETHFVTGPDELRELLMSRPSTPARTLIVEEFTAGEEWIVDGILSDGNLAFAAVTGYGEPCLSAVDGRRPVRMLKLDPARDPRGYREMTAFAHDCVTALGTFDGIFHLELFRSVEDGSLTFGECAARRGGGLLQEDTLIKHGVDLAEESLLAAVGHGRAVEPQINPREVGSTLIPCPPGVLFEMPTRAEIEGRKNVVQARVELPLGFSMGGTNNTLFKLGGATLEADSVEELHTSMDDLLRWCETTIRVVPPGQTAAQLRSTLGPSFAAVQG